MLSIGKKLNDKARAIAYVKGGQFDEYAIFLNNDNLDATLEEKMKLEKNKPKNGDNIDIYEHISENELRKLIKKVYGMDIRLKSKDYKLLNKLLTEGIEPQDERLKKIYDLLKSEIKTKPSDGKEIIIYDGFVQQLPRKNEDGNIIGRQYVAAPSEAGKSTYLAGIIKEYKKMKPKAPIWLFSDTPKDDKIDKLGVKRVVLDDELIDDPIEAEELMGPEEADFHSMVIFDDIDSIISKPLFKSVSALRDQILQKGRHHFVSCIVTNHKLTDYKNTSIILNEDQFITLFPKATSKYHFDYILKTYCGMSPEQIDKAYNLPTRAVSVSKNYPRFVLYQSGIYLI